VRVELEANGRGLMLAVEDNGPGVPERDRDRIWEPYVRLDQHRRSSIAGTGIGLAVVRELVRRCGGTCHVARGAAGARFVVTLPATRERAHAVAAL
jgi:signal transduction histidine kinase